MSQNSYSQWLKSALPDGLKRRLARLFGREHPPSSSNSVILNEPAPSSLALGWREPEIAARQREAFDPLLEELRRGNPRLDFATLAAAVESCQANNPSIIEVGCAHGWNSEVLARLLRRPARYIGIDYSPAMVAMGRRAYPQLPFLAGDAARLPLKDHSCDVLILGTVLMHLLSYREAIRECGRVTKTWCILHTVPVLREGPTTVLKKLAYGSPVIEIVFNGEELMDTIGRAGFVVRHRFDSIPHDYLSETLGEPVSAYTYLCERSS